MNKNNNISKSLPDINTYLYSSSQLGFYIAGLIEGDGNIWTPKTLRSCKGRINNPEITFTFHKKERTFFETGSLYEERLSNICKYRISDKDKLIQVVNLINGKFRTPKIKYLYKAIDHINLLHSRNIQKLPLNNSDLGSNSWIAGFADADGNFTISLEGCYAQTLSDNKSQRGRVKCIFSIKQRVIDKASGESLVPIMTNIAKLFECKINYRSTNEMTFMVQANNKHSLTTSYFDKYPLMTSEYLDYLCFVKGLNY